MECKKILTNKQKCRAKAQKNKDLCFRHDPDNEAAVMVASRKGGQNRALQGFYGEAVKLNSPEDVKNFLGLVINGVWAGGVPVPVGGSMGFLTRCCLDAFEASDVTKRLDEIENKLSNLNQ